MEGFHNTLGHTGLMRSAHPSCKNTARRHLRCFFFFPTEKCNQVGTTVQISSYRQRKKKKNTSIQSAYNSVWIHARFTVNDTFSNVGMKANYTKSLNLGQWVREVQQGRLNYCRTDGFCKVSEYNFLPNKLRN